MSTRRRDKEVGITMWETLIVKNVASGPLVGLNAIKEERSQMNEMNMGWSKRRLSRGTACLVGWLAMEPPSGL